MRTGTALELAVEGVPVGGTRGRGGGGEAAPGAGGRQQVRGAPVDAGGVAGMFARHGRRDSAAGCRAGFDELARGQHRRPHGQLPVPGAAEVGDHGRPQRRRLSWLAVFQDHHRRHGPRAGRHRGRRTRRPARLHRRARTTLAHGPTCRRHLAHHAQSRCPIPKKRWLFRPWAAVSRRCAKFDPKSEKQRWLFKTP